MVVSRRRVSKRPLALSNAGVLLGHQRVTRMERISDLVEVRVTMLINYYPHTDRSGWARIEPSEHLWLVKFQEVRPAKLCVFGCESRKCGLGVVPQPTPLHTQLSKIE